MELFRKIRRHFAVAGGDFETMFRNVEIPPLPAGAARLVRELNRSEPDLKRLAMTISAQPELSASVLRTVNSAYYSLPHRVKTVHHAIVLLGPQRVRSIALSHAMIEAVPRPAGDVFDHGAFWTDSLVRALLARAFTAERGEAEAEEAFATMLLADVALPVLLCSWREYYSPVLVKWGSEGGRLSGVERGDFGWDHAQAGAWILRTWDFPEETVCHAGAHTLPMESLRELDLHETIALPMTVAALAPSVLKKDAERSVLLVREAAVAFGLGSEALAGLLCGVRDRVEEMRGLFSLEDRGASGVLDELAEIASTGAGGIP
jgi:HD-like signal output (HDOD) protein